MDRRGPAGDVVTLDLTNSSRFPARDPVSDVFTSTIAAGAIRPCPTVQIER